MYLSIYIVHGCVSFFFTMQTDLDTVDKMVGAYAMNELRKVNIQSLPTIEEKLVTLVCSTFLLNLVNEINIFSL